MAPHGSDRSADVAAGVVRDAEREPVALATEPWGAHGSYVPVDAAGRGRGEGGEEGEERGEERPRRSEPRVGARGVWWCPGRVAGVFSNEKVARTTSEGGGLTGPGDERWDRSRGGKPERASGGVRARRSEGRGSEGGRRTRGGGERSEGAAISKQGAKLLPVIR